MTPAPIVALPPSLVEGHLAWRGVGFEQDRELYARLASEGQRPPTLLVQCSDSRVDGVALFGAAPGELFAVRNVANLVPPAEARDGISAAIAYAVGVLGVGHIVVLGHSGCGGVAACADLCAGQDLGDAAITEWVSHLRPAWDSAGADDLVALGHEAVRLSLRNLLGYPAVAEAVDRGALVLHGAWIDIASGTLHAIGDDGAFTPV